MLVVFVSIPFLKAPEERHIVTSSGATRLFACLSATNISLLAELKPADGINFALMGVILSPQFSLRVLRNFFFRVKPQYSRSTRKAPNS